MQDTIENYCLYIKVNATYSQGSLDPFEKREASSAWREGYALVMCVISAFVQLNVRFVINDPAEIPRGVLPGSWQDWEIWRSCKVSYLFLNLKTC